jgi:hypothetical protein
VFAELVGRQEQILSEVLRLSGDPTPGPGVVVANLMDDAEGAEGDRDSGADTGEPRAVAASDTAGDAAIAGTTVADGAPAETEAEVAEEGVEGALSSPSAAGAAHGGRKGRAIAEALQAAEELSHEQEQEQDMNDDDNTPPAAGAGEPHE